MSSITVDQTTDVLATAALPTEASVSATAALPTETRVNALPTEAGLALPTEAGVNTLPTEAGGMGGCTPQDMILRQTDYTIEMAQQKLLEHNNDVVQVIREYMKPQAKQQSIPPKPLSTNQQIYKEIRGMMDDAAATYNAKKQ